MIWSLFKIVTGGFTLWLSGMICLAILGYDTLEAFFWPFVAAYVVFEWICTALVYSFVPLILFFGIKNLITRKYVNHKHS
jgi:hypothetical protein